MSRVPWAGRAPRRGAPSDPEQFFEDLVGTPHARTGGVGEDLAGESPSAARSEADAFFADLMGVGGAPRVAPSAGSAAESPPVTVGWTGSSVTENRSQATFSGVKRVPIEGLTVVRRALVLLPPNFDATKRVDVVVHLHGANLGYDHAMDPSRKPRDLAPDRDRIEEQLAAARRPQLVMVLPQGVDEFAYTHGLGQINPRVYAVEALDGLVTATVLGTAPTVRNVVLSGHSGGGFAMKTILDVPATRRDIAGTLWFDAIQAEQDTADGGRVTTGQRELVKKLLRERIKAEIDALSALTSPSDADQARALSTGFELRSYFDALGSYASANQEIERDIKALFGEASTPPPRDRDGAALAPRIAQLPASARTALRARYQVTAVPRAASPAAHQSSIAAGSLDTLGHDNMVGSNALKDALDKMPFGR